VYPETKKIKPQIAGPVPSLESRLQNKQKFNPFPILPDALSFGLLLLAEFSFF
jgi:hypothetical protein